MGLELNEVVDKVRRCVQEKHGMTFSDWDVNLKNWESQYGYSKDMNFKFAKFVLNHFIKVYEQRSPFSEDIYQLLRELHVLKHSLLISSGKKVSSNTKAFNRLEILRSALREFECQYTIATVPDCNYCQQFANSVLSFDEALLNFPLDYSKCDRWSGCVCMVLVEAKRDENDNLIMKVQDV